MQFIVFFQPLGYFQAGNFGQLDVHQDKVWLVFAGKVQRLQTIHGLDRAITIRFKEIVEELHVKLVVLNDHDRLGHGSKPIIILRNGALLLCFKQILPRSNTLISFRNGKQSTDRPPQPDKSGANKTGGFENAESLAIRALQHLASSEDLLPRFLALSGIDLASLRDAAGEPGFLAGILDFYLGHEPNLIELAQFLEIKPEEIAKARAILDPVGPAND